MKYQHPLPELISSEFHFLFFYSLHLQHIQLAAPWSFCIHRCSRSNFGLFLKLHYLKCNIVIYLKLAYSYEFLHPTFLVVHLSSCLLIQSESRQVTLLWEHQRNTSVCLLLFHIHSWESLCGQNHSPEKITRIRFYLQGWGASLQFRRSSAFVAHTIMMQNSLLKMKQLFENSSENFYQLPFINNHQFYE